MGSRRPGRYLKRLVVAVGFTLTDYGPVGSHGDLDITGYCWILLHLTVYY